MRTKRRTKDREPIILVARAQSWNSSFHTYSKQCDNLSGSSHQEIQILARLVRHDSKKLGNVSSCEITIHAQHDLAEISSLAGYIEVRGGVLGADIWVSIQAVEFATQLISSGRILFLGLLSPEFRYRRTVPTGFWFDTQFIEDDYF